MQTANIMVALGGDKGTTVPKYNVTASEIAVLRAIHGADAVTDVEPVGEIERPHREEIARLTREYGRARVPDANGNDVSIVASLFPGAAARTFRTIEELEIPEEFFKAETRVKAKPAPAKPTKGKGKVKPDEDEAADDATDDVADDEKLFG